MREILETGFNDLNISVPDGALSLFIDYCAILEDKNRHTNLTAIKGSDEIARLHFLDCAALLSTHDFKNKSIVDIGSGAGFPGLPLKILEPSIKLTMVDSLQKRCDFLRDVTAGLGIQDAEILHMRAEELAPAHRDFFNIAVSRALAKLNMLIELCLPYVAVGGTFIAMKGPEPEEEIAEASSAIELLGGGDVEIYPYSIPGTDIIHTAVKISKIIPTPGQFPRRFAKIQKSPL